MAQMFREVAEAYEASRQSLAVCLTAGPAEVLRNLSGAKKGCFHMLSSLVASMGEGLGEGG